MADNLSNQHDNLMSGCSQSVVTSVKVELDSNYKRLHNSEAALKTWHEYLFKIKNIAKLYEDIASNFEQIFIKVHEGIDNEVCPTRESTFAIADIRQKIDKLLVIIFSVRINIHVTLCSNAISFKYRNTRKKSQLWTKKRTN